MQEIRSTPEKTPYTKNYVGNLSEKGTFHIKIYPTKKAKAKKDN
jgi:hypothetical protein